MLQTCKRTKRHVSRKQTSAISIIHNMTLMCDGLVGPGNQIRSVNSTETTISAYIYISIAFVDSYFEMLVLAVAFVPYVGMFQNCFDVFLIPLLIWQIRLVNYARGCPS